MEERGKVLRHGSLFSGIGGFDLAAEWIGWENIFHCEINPFCQKILKYYFPEADYYEDIKKTDFRRYRGEIDVLTGGFPCQPFSVAGKRLGKEDERHLWPEMLRAIREITPKWIVGENVLGIVSWNDGMVFEEVQSDLEGEGYSVQPYVIPAAGVNAPHRRDRVWFVAHADGFRWDNQHRKAANASQGKTDEYFSEGAEIRSHSTPASGAGIPSYTGILGRDGGWGNREEQHFQADLGAATESQPERQERKTGTGKIGKIPPDTVRSAAQNIKNQAGSLRTTNQERATDRPEYKAFPGYWEKWPSQSPICNGDDGISGELDGITFPKWRTESIMAGGNAIVPQVVYQIFRTINTIENTYHGFK